MDCNENDSLGQGLRGSSERHVQGLDVQFFLSFNNYRSQSICFIKY